MSAFVSVCIPAHNCEKTIKACVNSLLLGTYKDIEIYLAEDKSQDGTLALCKELAAKDSRVRLIEVEPCTLSKARNYGIAASSSNYVGFVDADDWVEPNFYEALVGQALAAGSDITIAGIVREFDSYTIKTEITQNKFIPQEEYMNYYKKSITRALGPVWNRLYSRRLFKKGLKFPDDFSSSEDAVFNVRANCLAENGFSFATGASYHYNSKSTNLGSLSKNKEEARRSAKINRAFPEIRKALYAYFKESDISAVETQIKAWELFGPVLEQHFCLINGLKPTWKPSVRELIDILKHDTELNVKCSSLLLKFAPPPCIKSFIRHMRKYLV